MNYYSQFTFAATGASTGSRGSRGRTRSPKPEGRTRPETRRPKLPILSGLAALSALCLVLTGCGKSESGGGGETAKKQTIQNQGSDTMVNLAQAWAEEYSKVAPEVKVEVGGGGSGVGIAALEKGTIDIANASRNMKPEEIEAAKRNTGKEPKEFIVGYDALAIYVHKENPLNEITLDQIAQIYAEGGTITKWTDLGVQVPGTSDQEIVRVSRQSNSGTYEFLREHVLHNKDYKLGSRDMRLQGSGRAGFLHTYGHRLQRHGLCDAGRQDVEGEEDRGRPGLRTERGQYIGQDLPHRPLAPGLYAGRASRRS